MVVGAVLTLALAAAPSPCPHPYFPMEEGLTLTYRAGKSEIPIQFTDVKAGKGTLSGKVQMVVKGKTGSTRAECSKDGIVTEAGGLEGMALNSSGMDVEIEKAEGIVMPPPAELVKPGTKWSNTITMSMRPPKSADGNGLKAALNGALVIRTTLKKESTVVGPDHVDTEAGSFDALKIANKTSALSGENGAIVRSVESTMWLVPNLGIVKIVTGNSTDFELVKVERAKSAMNTSGK